MMVKMQERRSGGRMQAVLNIWHDTTWKLALLFFPLAAFEKRCWRRAGQAFAA